MFSTGKQDELFMTKYICIHGHFYQPPRENAWLEVIEQQDSAWPFHDWNERITYECYGPNGASRMLDQDRSIINILNNYSRISFNFGPTLLHWMERSAPEAYQAVIRADKESMEHFGGHGSALAQVYNHIIMPLATYRDKVTQVKWGIRDFEHRFGRKPEGMWLAETAVDTETLEVLADHGIGFTILAPRQAEKIKKIGSDNWLSISDEGIPTHRPYLCKLPSGKNIVLFFYNGEVSQDIAFKGLLADGGRFAERLIEGFSTDLHENQLMHVATDGESYGHHHRHGDMALAYCLDKIQNGHYARLTNYAEYISLNAPAWEVQIHENSSWSCVHGVERWRNDCGCNSGMNPGWHQKWRAPLRESLDWLRDRLAKVFEQEVKPFCKDPWALRDAYIEVILNRDEINLIAFLKKYFHAGLNEKERTHVLRMLELQRHALLMYTSCGWFFDEISGIETTQILQYADRAIQLTESETEVRLEHEFLQRLSQAKGNIPAYPDGAGIHKTFVQPSRLTLSRVGSHYAVASLFEDFPEVLTICNYRAESEHYERIEAGSFRLAVGKTHIHSLITCSVREFYFAVVWLGENHIIGNSTSFMEEEDFFRMKQEITLAFTGSQIAEVIGIMQTFFGPDKFSLWNLFKDEQRKVISQIINKDVLQAEESFRRIYNQNYNIVSVMNDAGLPIPAVLVRNLENVINSDIRHFFENGNLYPSRLEKLASDAIKWKVELDKTAISFAASIKLFNVIRSLEPNDQSFRTLETLIRIFDVMAQLDIDLDLWEFQNVYFRLGNQLKVSNDFGQFKDEKARIEWFRKYQEIGRHIQVKLPVFLEATA
jgi:alpha-amylase/alpha-mannosidase (GH57 family)